MRDEALSRRGRRAPAPPAALRTELVRGRLVGRIAERFSVPLAVVVAGAGFGKSTLPAQAARANQLDPRGVDAWVSCEPGDVDAGHLAAGIVAALGQPVDDGGHAERVLDALARFAPVDVCLTVDDVHELPPGSSGAALLTEIVTRLPPHAHLVVSGRSWPLADARRRAVIEIGADELAFTVTEAAALGELVGGEEQDGGLERLAGWPSLVRLSLSAPDSAPQFLWEEIVARLDSRQRTTLLALATLGWGTAADVARVAGLGDVHDVDLDGLVASVPLTRREADGWYGAHQLWEDAVERIFPDEVRRRPRERALALFRERGETLRTGWQAIKWGDAAALRSAARNLVRETLGALPIDTAERWLAATSVDDRRTPELRLLELALVHARRYDDSRLDDDDIDAVAAEFAAAGDSEATAVVLAFGAVVAQTRGDEARLVAIDERARTLESAHNEPTLRFLAAALSAAVASLRGDVDAALAAVDGLSYDEVPAPITELVTRLHNAVLWLSGRADEAVAISAPLADSSSAYVRTIPNHARWLAGDASAFTAGHLDAVPEPGTNERYHFYHAAYVTAVAASFGDVSTIERLRPIVDKFAAGTLDSRDRAMIALSRALRLVAHHDDEAAAREIGDHVDAHPAADRLADIHLRRSLPIAYVCDERVRARWREAELGPAQQRQRAVADHLLAARAGELTARSVLPDAAAVCTALPLAWSVELACRAQGAGCAAARRLAAGLAALAPAAIRGELEHAAEHGDPALRGAAMALLDAVPDAGAPAVEIGVLGELRVTLGGDVVVSDDLRRRRVRMLVELLVLTGGAPREQLAEVMWPGLDPPAAGRNLRVTMSRLRAALDTGGRGRCPALRLDGSTVALAGPPCVDVDLWRLGDDVAAADEAERRGDPSAAIAALERACARWRGDPFPDVDETSELAGDLEAIRLMLATTALRLGALLLVGGRFDDAAAWAERVRRASPYDERAHRLAIAAHLQRSDRDAVLHATAAAWEMLDDLGVDPEPETRMLLRQAAARCGALAAASLASPR